jgi:two-component system, LytTR family, response regulator
MPNQTINNQLLVLSVTEGIFRVDPSDIIRMRSSNSYTLIYFTNRKPLLIAKVLKRFADALAAQGFIRTHRAHLINKKYIHSIDSEGHVLMNDASVAAISRRLRGQVLQQLQSLAAFHS